jgi:hypothetical protein
MVPSGRTFVDSSLGAVSQIFISMKRQSIYSDIGYVIYRIRNTQYTSEVVSVMNSIAESESSSLGIDAASEHKVVIPESAPVESAPEGRVKTDATIRLQMIGGVAVMIVLLLLPFVTVVGSVILVLVCEVYLTDWLYSKYSVLTGRASHSGSFEARRIRQLEKTIDENAARPHPLDQVKR